MGSLDQSKEGFCATYDRHFIQRYDDERRSTSRSPGLILRPFFVLAMVLPASIQTLGDAAYDVTVSGQSLMDEQRSILTDP